MMLDFKNFLISYKANIMKALAQIDTFSVAHALVLFVQNEQGQVIGSVSDGDIRRALLAGHQLDDCIADIMHKEFRYMDACSSYKIVREFKAMGLKLVPLLDADKKLIEIIDLNAMASRLPVDAILMAGGKGVRLKPYTNDVPKPMLALNNKPILGHCIERLLRFGIKNVYISINHLKEQIIKYIDENYSDKVNIYYIEEKEPLGTIGSLGLVEKYASDNVLIMNADILTNIDFEDFFASHQELEADMSVASFNIKIDIPYAVLDRDGEYVKSFIEKPSYTYYSNAGIYLLKTEHVGLIPLNEKYDSTDLIERLISLNGKVSHFPIRGYWLDIGNVQNYAKAQEDIKFIKF